MKKIKTTGSWAGWDKWVNDLYPSVHKRGIHCYEVPGDRIYDWGTVNIGTHGDWALGPLATWTYRMEISFKEVPENG
jgi:hypothetical protein